MAFAIASVFPQPAADTTKPRRVSKHGADPYQALKSDLHGHFTD